MYTGSIKHLVDRPELATR